MYDKQYFIYILTNKYNTALYIGFTGKALAARIWERKEKLVEGFTKKYNINKLVYYEVFDNPEAAISREKQLKAGSRRKKFDLINKMNPKWNDLYEQIC